MRKLFLLALLLSACKKKDTPTTIDYTDQLTGIWKISAKVSDKPYDWMNTGQKITDILAAWPPCSHNYTLAFNQGGKGTFYDGCGNQYTITWSGKDAKLHWSDGGLRGADEDIEYMGTDSFRTRLVTVPPDQVTYTVKTTYQRK